ncbi:MAG: hypothetical protein J1F40_03690 [Prevotellaceae bacterium]|nr:hypothetical protein [Prevotellaceae bacterium]
MKDLFEVRYGVDLELNSMEQTPKGINFVARTSKNNGVTARVLPIPWISPNPAGSISVAAGGSVMESFLQKEPYYSGRDLFCLIPRVEMSDAVKLFYCMCLRHNKFRYSYGRQANETLKDLQIPVLEDIPEYVKVFSMPQFKARMVNSVEVSALSDKSTVTAARQELVPLNTLFRLENGIASTDVLRSPIKETVNWVPYIRPSYTQNTSVDAYVNKNLVPQKKVYPKGTLYVSTNGQGSHTYSYVSVSEFVPNSDVTVLLPLRPMTIREKLFYSMCISHNRFKFSYGRKPKGERLASIMLPKAIDEKLNDMDLLGVLNKL